MSYANFIGEVWSETIDRGLDAKCVFAEDCHKLYDGTAKNPGEAVKLVGFGDPTVYTIDRANALKKIEEPEVVEDLSQTMVINVMSYFNYLVGDIDKIQSKFGIEKALSPRVTSKMAAEIDTHVASCTLDKSIVPFSSVPLKVVTDTPVEGEINVLRALTQMATRLYKNNVSQNEKIVANVSPDFYELFIWAYGGRATNNVEILEYGRAARYGNITIKMSNNVAKTKDGAELVTLRTPEAIAYVHTHTKTEAYRPEGMFADAVKGFALYQAKVIHPKEIITLPVTY